MFFTKWCEKRLEAFKNTFLTEMEKRPHRESPISEDSLKYWLRRERQAKLDLKGLVD
jgi:ABC-type Zn uptake system ZnuABC Zn-binding protein ZnuA